MTTPNSTAIHEAGHAVVGYACGRRIKRVTIKAAQETLGHVAYTPLKPGVQLTPGQAVKHIKSALAGYLAERAFGFRPRRYTCEQDREAAAD